MQINIPLDPAAVVNAIDGNKTYLGLAVGAAVIVANHFGVLPPNLTPPGLDPNNWLIELWALYLGATTRSALKKAPARAPAVTNPSTS